MIIVKRTVPISVNGEVDLGNAHHKAQWKSEINCAMMEAYWKSVSPNGIPRYFASPRYIIPSLLIPRYFSDTGISRIPRLPSSSSTQTSASSAWAYAMGTLGSIWRRSGACVIHSGDSRRIACCENVEARDIESCSSRSFPRRRFSRDRRFRSCISWLETAHSLV